jgi:FlaG/FlaF family flagellin (archaellin)
MHYLKRQKIKNSGDAVSPVVGVMLMLVVTIIIAAVVSAFAGSTVSGTQKAPSASLEFHVKNTGTPATSYFSMKVLGVSEPISTKNLNLITSWQSNMTSGNPLTGGSTSSISTGYPTGFGNGVGDFSGDAWGNFTLESGTTTYDSGSGSLTSILGTGWNTLNAGDTVSVRIIDVRSGKTIADQNVVVEGP